MEIKQLLLHGREIWGQKKLNLSQIITCLGTVFGDICRLQRDADQRQTKPNEQELKKELGNIIFSTIRWCDDLGYDPEECLALAQESQKKYTNNAN